jgi:hypothetical protein
MLSVMGAFAEFERALIGERQCEGITLAKAPGAYRGRRKAHSPEQQGSCGGGPARGSRRPAWPGSSASAAKPFTNSSGEQHCAVEVAHSGVKQSEVRTRISSDLVCLS